MSLTERWERDGWLKLLAALLINLLFLLSLFACFTFGYEANDDFYMSGFVDGQLSEKTAFIPFVNIVQGLLLKLCYVLGGDKLPWYTACQYVLMLFGFSAVTWVLLRRFRLLPALTMTVIILLSSGMDAYLTLNFSKTAAIATVGGLSLMLFGLEGEGGAARRRALCLGFALALLGFFWRYEVFFTVAAIMAPVGFVSILEMLFQPGASGAKRHLRQIWHYARPFLLLLLAVALFYGVAYWNQWYNAMLYIENAKLFPLHHNRMCRHHDTDSFFLDITRKHRDFTNGAFFILPFFYNIKHKGLNKEG